MHYWYLEKLAFQLVLEIIKIDLTFFANDDKNFQGYLAR